MKRFAVPFALLFGAWGNAGAQGPMHDKVMVNFPYTVTIGERTLPPGSYTIEEDQTAGTKSYVLHVFSDNGMKLETTVGTLPAVKNTTPEDTRLVLNHYGSDYYIDQMWVQGKDYGYQFLKPDILKSRERERAESASLPASFVRGSDRSSYMAADRFARPEATPGPIGQSSDSGHDHLALDARNALVSLPQYSVFDHFDLRVDGNTVTLMGQVTRPTLKTDAENAVRKIEGVGQVVNNIETLPASSSDDRLRASVYRAIYGNASMATYSAQATPPIHIIVNNGNVTLEGTVVSQADKDMAETQTNSVPGVFSVADDLRVSGV
jgi:hyperosmotically inducible protein